MHESCDEGLFTSVNGTLCNRCENNLFQILKCISQLELAQLIGTGVKTMGTPGGVGQGTTTPVTMGTAGFAPSHAQELVNGEWLTLARHRHFLESAYGIARLKRFSEEVEELEEAHFKH